MTKKTYLDQFCKDVCGQCRLPKPEKCFWKAIMSQAWDASHKATLEGVKSFLDSHQLSMIDGDTFGQMEAHMKNEGRD